LDYFIKNSIFLTLAILEIFVIDYYASSKPDQKEEAKPIPKWNQYDENTRPHYIGEVETEYEQYFEDAVDELTQMVEGEIPLDFKRGVFLIENAFYKGALNWEEFNNEIQEMAKKIQPIIERNRFRGGNLALNWGVFTYMSDSIPENNNYPFGYDYDTFLADYDGQAHMVSHTLKTKKGNCISLPFLYKILANEVGAKAHLATAPMHLFIKIQDDTGEWHNHEVTAGSFSRTSFIIESFGVTDRALHSGLHMKPLTEMESIGYLLEQLIFYYEDKTGKYYGDIVMKAINAGLKARPVSMLLGSLLEEKSLRIYYFLEQNNLPLNSLEVINTYPYTQKLHEEILILKQQIANIGYVNFTAKRYKKLFDDILKNKEAKEKNIGVTQ